VEQLERRFAGDFGFSGAVATGFGRAALRLALEALDLRGGDVLVPNFICAQIPQAVRLAGGRPVFYHVRRDLSVAAEDFRSALAPATRAAVVAHYFGRRQPGVAALVEICRPRGIPLLEDCALALGVTGIGALGDAAVFSFTKSDWCYGGALLAARSIDLLERARAARMKLFRGAPTLAFRYGILRRADFAANRPTLSRTAELAGRALESISGFRSGNFYDAGQFDTFLPSFAALRANHILSDLPTAIRRRKEILRQIRDSLTSAPGILFRPDDPGDSGAFLLLKCNFGAAHSWLQRAAREGITLRLCWPAYQEPEAGQGSAELRWLANHLLLLEIHPKLNDREVQRIARCLRELSRGG
jgi:dTDP-4-amino-4,6-dideoxygalactose transaminase